MTKAYRCSSQLVIPAQKPADDQNGYTIYPSFPLRHGRIHRGIRSLAEQFRDHKTILVDGYTGVLWEAFRRCMDAELMSVGIHATWIDISLCSRPLQEIEAMVAPFLGGDDPLFGTRADLHLIDFFDPARLESLASVATNEFRIFYGPGAFLTGVKGFNVYLDIPKNEIQYRSRAGSITNLGTRLPDTPKKMYKRFYFVDWIVLNRHKEKFIDSIDLFADLQRPGDITWGVGDYVRSALDDMAVNYFRVRPWFEPGTWGGTWIRRHISGLSSEVPNYAWSFELIVPENGLLLEGDGHLLEISFDWLMYRAAPKILGLCHPWFGNEFPIRFDFLDTFGGGNLSIQCHPGKEYMKSHFGEDFTQEETYYILDAGKDASVYLGFREGIDPSAFEQVLRESFRDSLPVDIEHYVQCHPSAKHDLFLIPPGTIHGSGINNLVLEISSTPYIFTFKLYDWLRPDLDGKPRQLNITRGMDNLRFDRCGERVKHELIATPILLDKGRTWELWHLPTHPDHLYDVCRYEFTGEITVETNGRVHVLSLVEGTGITVCTPSGMRQTFRFAETFVIPAATGSYTLFSESPLKSMLIIAFVK